MLEELPHLLLSRAEAEEKRAASSRQGDWLLLVDPETIVTRFVWRDERGVVADMQGHEDLFPLGMALEGVLEGGDWVTASTPDLREPDGLYRSYRVQWLEELERPVGLLLLIGGRQTPNLLSARALQPHVIVPIVSNKFIKTWQHVELRDGKAVFEGLAPVLENLASRPIIAKPQIVDGLDLPGIRAACLDGVASYPGVEWTFNVTCGSAVMSIGAFDAAKQVGASAWYLDSASGRAEALLGTAPVGDVFSTSVAQYLQAYNRRCAPKSASPEWKAREAVSVNLSRQLAHNTGLAWAFTNAAKAATTTHGAATIFNVRGQTPGFLRSCNEHGFISDLNFSGTTATFQIARAHHNFLKADWLEVYAWACAVEAGCFSDVQWGVNIPTVGLADNELDLMATRSGALLIAECKTDSYLFDTSRKEKAEVRNGYIAKLDSIANFIGGSYVARLLITLDEGASDAFKDQARERKIVLVGGKELKDLPAILKREAGALPLPQKATYALA